MHRPENQETVALIHNDTHELKYGVHTPSANKKYQMLWLDAMAALHETGEESDCDDYTPRKI